MSREKQIEEIARIIHNSVDTDKPCLDEKYGGFSCLGCDYLDKEYCQHDIERATGLYKAGYRKQTEGEWKTDTTSWLYKNARKFCSNCGKTALYDSFMGKYHLTNFCPNCGAQMKGGAE